MEEFFKIFTKSIEITDRKKLRKIYSDLIDTVYADEISEDTVRNCLDFLLEKRQVLPYDIFVYLSFFVMNIGLDNEYPMDNALEIMKHFKGKGVIIKYDNSIIYYLEQIGYDTSEITSDKKYYLEVYYSGIRVRYLDESLIVKPSIIIKNISDLEKSLSSGFLCEETYTFLYNTTPYIFKKNLEKDEYVSNIKNSNRYILRNDDFDLDSYDIFQLLSNPDISPDIKYHLYQKHYNNIDLDVFNSYNIFSAVIKPSLENIEYLKSKGYITNNYEFKDLIVEFKTFVYTCNDTYDESIYRGNIVEWDDIELRINIR